LLDWLVIGHVIAVNPATSVHGPKHVVRRGKTTVLTADETRVLLDSIALTRAITLSDGTIGEAPDLVGLRDRALISVMTFAFGRISAVLGMRVEDYYPQGKRWRVRLHKKGGKRHEMPAHHNLEAYLDEYIKAAGISDDDKSPLFRSALGRTGLLTDRPMHRVDAWNMIQRRAAAAGLETRISCHVQVRHSPRASDHRTGALTTFLGSRTMRSSSHAGTVVIISKT
jgi:site-specific recombinase XerC